VVERVHGRLPLEYPADGAFDHSGTGPVRFVELRTPSGAASSPSTSPAPRRTRSSCARRRSEVRLLRVAGVLSDEQLDQALRWARDATFVDGA